jgi:hypothetical protein
MVTQQDKRRLIEILNTASTNGASMPATARLIHEELPHLTAAEVIEISRVHRDELRLDAAVYMAQGQAYNRIAEIIKETGQQNLGGALNLLAARANQGDRHATELLEELGQAFTTVTLSD